ncbi:hypothetical protein IEQ44_07975 [Nocardioides sp. Y6]|uniref:Uncharacterized protein n=1 Tax=Nocardioides malaquae TaxID=2773426 RepID=A0ABR9RTU5_9ACTN|nr:hypothetical protein [Nocardioides malaquae]MBE7324587.1 hypothetical protein [Nocardioides malaquae]
MTATEPPSHEPPDDPASAETEHEPLDIHDIRDERTRTPEEDEAARKELLANLRTNTDVWKRATRRGVGSAANLGALGARGYGIERFKFPNHFQSTMARITESNRAMLKRAADASNLIPKGTFNNFNFDGLGAAAYANLTESHKAQMNNIVANFMPRVETPKFDFDIDRLRAASLASSAFQQPTYPSLTRMLASHPAVTARFAPAFQTSLKGSRVPDFDFGLAEHLKSLLNLDLDLDLDRFSRLIERFKPRNLRGIEIDISIALTLMREEAIPFALVTDPETATLLVEAADSAARKKILVQRAESIFDACDDVISLSVNDDLPQKGVLIRSAIATYRDGHHEAAQALATVILDGLVSRHPNNPQLKNADEGHAYIDTKHDFRDAFFLLPLPTAHIKTYSEEYKKSDRSMYNRHATVHTVADGQLTSGNAVQAIMLASSLLGFYQNLW